MYRHERHLIPAMLLFLLLSRPANAFAVDFANPVSYPAGTGPASALAVDFDGDGKLDLAVANAGSGNIGILLGAGDGTFHPAVNFDAGMANPTSLAVGDFNGDGKLDLAVFQLSPNGLGSLSAGVLSILLGNGDGSFQAPKTTTLAVAIDLAVADFNLDHKADVAFTDYDQSSDITRVFILVGNGDSSFQPARQITVFRGGFGYLAAADFNNDAKPDLAVGVSAGIHLLVGKGDGSFQTGADAAVAAGFVVESIQAGDANGEGKQGLLVQSSHFEGPPLGNNEGPTRRADNISFFLGNGQGTLQAERIAASSSWSKSTVFSPAVGDSISRPVLGDFNGDRKLDIAFSRDTFSALSRTKALEIQLGKGDATFLSALSFPDSNPVGATADLNGDTLSDLIFLDSNAVLVALNTTSAFKMNFLPAEFQPVHAGGSASLTVSIESVNGFGDVVTLACSSPASVGINCSTSPSSLATGSSAMLTVTTTGPSAVLTPLPNRTVFYLGVWLPIFGLCLAGLSVSLCGHRKKTSVGPMLVLALAGLLLLGGCGGSNSNGPGNVTPLGHYAITIMGTSGSTQHSTTMTLSVQ